MPLHLNGGGITNANMLVDAQAMQATPDGIVYANPSKWNAQMPNDLRAAKAVPKTQVGLVYAFPPGWVALTCQTCLL